MFPVLKTSYKHRYPFRLGTTSFIYPAEYYTNVRLLGPYLDEIELLLLESRHPKCFPSKGEIRRLVEASEAWQFTYNVHLPYDIHIADPNPATRKRAVEVLLHVFELTAPLAPVTHTLHVNYRREVDGRGTVVDWQARVEESLTRLIAGGISAESVSIETLHYPFEWIVDIIKRLGLRVCIDTGHLILQGMAPDKVFRDIGHDTVIVHLHGVENGRDHRSLDYLSSNDQWIFKMLKSFEESVSIEVFSYNELSSSLNHLDRLWTSQLGAKGARREIFKTSR